MPKTHGGLWEQVTCWDNLCLAYQQASKRKRYRDAVLLFRSRLEENLFDIQNRLLHGMWRPGKYREFTVYEPKKRLIMAPPFADRVVHHAIVNVVEPLFERKMIDHSYACRVGFGSHRAALQARTYLRAARRKHGNRVHVLKADISKYFPSVHIDALLAMYARTIREKPLLKVLELILVHGSRNGVGIPVGALTSQLSANVDLTPFDHFVKDDLGVKFYVRYVDDWIVVHESKQYLWDCLGKMEDMLDKLGLRLNRKTGVHPASHGVDFCGYRIWATHIRPRKRNVQRAKRRFRALARKNPIGSINFDAIRPVVASFCGYMKHCHGYTTAGSALECMTIGG
jgi:RNA-directed DNA polymerase